MSESVRPPERPSSVSSAEAAARGVLFPQVYTWFIFVASLDVIFTWSILKLGGRELNLLADYIIRRFDIQGAILYKFALVTLIVLICEVTGRMKYDVGLRLGRWAVAISAVPVVVGVIHLVAEFFGPNANAG